MFKSISVIICAVLALLLGGCSTAQLVGVGMGVAAGFTAHKVLKKDDPEAATVPADAASKPAQDSGISSKVTGLRDKLLGKQTAKPSTASVVPSSLEETLETARQDAATATLVGSATTMASVRTRRLTDRPATVAALKKLCSRGIPVEVLVQGASRQDGELLAGTCVRVYVASSPETTETADQVLVDFTKLFVKNSTTLAPTTVAYQELETRASLKSRAMRTN